MLHGLLLPALALALLPAPAVPAAAATAGPAATGEAVRAAPGHCDGAVRSGTAWQASCRALPLLPGDAGPRALAERVRALLPLPAPMGADDRAVAAGARLELRPAADARREVRVGASARGHRVTVAAVPRRARWEMGDGTVVTCEIPDGDCAHTYTGPSEHEPEGAYSVTAALSWEVRWWDGLGDGGVLDPLVTDRTRVVRVRDIDAQLR
ncbi:hypothetical protein [Nocardiopsis flavescens]